MYKLILIALMLITSYANAATYYVSDSLGNDANAGTSYTYPLKTITEALSKAQAAGDIVYVRNGTYSEAVTVSQSNITLAAMPGAYPIIDMASLPGSDWIVALAIEGNYNTVSGFEVRNVNLDKGVEGGYGLEASGHNNTIRNMSIHHTWEQAVLLRGDYNTIEDSSVYQGARRNFNGAMEPLGGGWPSGMSAARNNSLSAIIPGITSFPRFTRVKSYNNWGEGLSCFETDHCVIEDSIVYDNWTMNLYLSDSANATIARNLVYRSSAPAISFRAGGSPGIVLADEVANGTTIPYSTNNLIANNFIYNADIDAFSWTNVPSGLNNVRICDNTVAYGVIKTGTSAYGDPITNVNSQIRNNIFIDHFDRNSEVPDATGITFSDNNWTYTPPLAYSPSDVVGDAMVNLTGSTAPGALTGNYFKIGASSPLINQAVVVSGVVRDYFKATRGTQPDIGGHEYGAVLPVMSISSTTAWGAATNVGTVKWVTTEPATGVVQYGLSPSALTLSKSLTTTFLNQGLSIGSLTAGTKYYYRVVATNVANGQTATSAISSFTTPTSN